MSQRKIIPPEILLECYRRNEGNKRATARELGVDKDTLRKCLVLYGADTKPVVGGTIRALKHNVLPLPPKGKVYRYLLSSAQNNTRVFAPFLKNLEAYAEWLGDCRIMVARFTYNKNAFNNPASSKPGKQTKDSDQPWFDPAISEYVCDDPDLHGTRRWQLAPDLWWCSEMQVEATASRPLSDLATYTGEASSIFPHTRIAVEPVATLPGSPTKHLYTTGTVTASNYIQRKAGLKAAFHHEYAALVVEIDADANWWVRHLSADSKGSFYDCPSGHVVKVASGEVLEGQRAEAINWGDTHVEFIPEWRKQYYWGPGGVKDQLKPKYEFHNDLHGFTARSHHTQNNFIARLKLFLEGKDRVDKELDNTAEFLNYANRDFCTAVVVRANHDVHPEKWLNEANYRNDLPNCLYFLRAQTAWVEATIAGEKWMFLEWALKRLGCPEDVRFLKEGESFKICKTSHPIECGVHGHRGANGSRGSDAGLSRMGSKINKGHSHSYVKRDGLWSAGTCAEDQDYNEGQPGTWSVTHLVTYVSGKRTGLTERAGKLWA